MIIIQDVCDFLSRADHWSLSGMVCSSDRSMITCRNNLSSSQPHADHWSRVDCGQCTIYLWSHLILTTSSHNSLACRTGRSCVIFNSYVLVFSTAQSFIHFTLKWREYVYGWQWRAVTDSKTTRDPTRLNHEDSSYAKNWLNKCGTSERSLYNRFERPTPRQSVGLEEWNRGRGRGERNVVPRDVSGWDRDEKKNSILKVSCL